MGAWPRADGVLCGFGDFWTFQDPPELELLYGLGRTYWGQGFVTELAAVVVEYGIWQLHMRKSGQARTRLTKHPYACSSASGSRWSAGRSSAGATRSSSLCTAEHR